METVKIICTCTIYCFLAVITAACSLSAETRTPTVNDPSLPTEVGVIREERVLNICLAEEPDSLFLYADNPKSAESVFQAIYDGPIDTRGYELQPVILEKVPSLADGDAIFEKVRVNSGELIVDADGEVTPLENGVSYLPSGCKDESCVLVYSDEAGVLVEMDQLVAEFRLLPDFTWSDGTAVTAEDSVYSFDVMKMYPTNQQANLISKTYSYLALSSEQVEWRGLPGFRDANYGSNFITPLPRHAWESISQGDLNSDEESSRQPMGYGAYYVESWEDGGNIQLRKNEYYFRSDEGLPYFDTVTYHIADQGGEQAIGMLQDGTCDVLDESIYLGNVDTQIQSMRESGLLQFVSAAGRAWEHLDFGILPISYDDLYNVAQGDRPNFFGDVRTRQAMAMCIDRQKIFDELSFGRGEVMNTYISSSHPLYNPDARSYVHDIDVGSNLLNEVGWVLNTEGMRTSQGVAGIPNGTSFEIGYFTTTSESHLAIAQIIGQSLLECGIQVNIATGSPDELFAPGPDGLLFGRQFDLAQFAWPLEDNPSCYLFQSEAVPGADVDMFPYSWGGWNLTGWRNADFDNSCKRALGGLPGEDGYLDSHYLAQQIFADELPVIPLFAHLIVVVARPDFCGLTPDGSESLFWNIELMDYGEECGNPS